LGGKFKLFLVGYLVVAGVIAHLVAGVGFIAAINYFKLTPHQFVVKAAKKTGIDAPWLMALLSPQPRYSDHPMDGQIKAAHPRILLPEISTGGDAGHAAFMQHRTSLYEAQGITAYSACNRTGILALAACWAVKADADKARQLIAELKAYRIETPDVSAQYGNGWQLALAYDLVAFSAELSADDRAVIEVKIEQALRDYLALLDDKSPSLWHGRTSLAASAWLCAIVLNPMNEESAQLIARAQGHFLDLIKALTLTEAWPEGYNYWIQERAFLVVLASAAYLNGLEGKVRRKDEINSMLKRLGLWHVYATRPDNRIEGFGDEGSRVDLKDETRRVIDLITQLTRDPIFSTFSQYLENLHGRESYYSGYHWAFKLLNDPSVPGLGFTGEGLQALAPQLPRAELFGRDALNMLYIRSGWGPDDTFVSFKAGHSFAHHGHYDAGHFTLFKAKPLAINSSTYGSFMGANRLNYSIRSVAKNTLLVLRPDEKVRPNRFFEANVAAGGQRIVLPTGSAIQSVQHWHENVGKGQHLEGGRVLHYEHAEGDYTYIAADLTGAYNNTKYDQGGRGGKVSNVVRELVYLAKEDRLLVHDRVVSTNATYTKKWLLHTVDKPMVANFQVLKGDINNGILQSSSGQVDIRHGEGYLSLQRLYPADAVIRLVGGPDYQFYVETDGDDSVLDGSNYQAGASSQPWFDVGMWRLEIQPGNPREEDEFLVALSPSVGVLRQDSVEPLPINGDAKGLFSALQSIVIFARRAEHGELAFHVSPNQTRLYVFGLPEVQQVNIKTVSGLNNALTTTNGVLNIDLTDPQYLGGGSISLTW